jgi:energy-coupling factor transport system permease protein
MVTQTRLDPRVVGFGLLSVSVWIATTVSLVTGGVWTAALFALLVALRRRSQDRAILPRYWLAWVALVAVLTLLLYLLFAPGNGGALYRFGPLRITDVGLRTGAQMALRLIAFALLAVSAVLLSAPLYLAAGLTRVLLPVRRLGVPVQQVFYFTFFLLRMLPFLVREARTIRLAQQSRGICFSGSWAVRWRSLPAVILPVFSAAMRRGDQLAMALAARGFDIRRTPATVTILRFRRRDWILATSLLAGWGVWAWSRLS